MTAAAEANHPTPPHPLGRGGFADPGTALQAGATPSTPAAAPCDPNAAPVILASQARAAVNTAGAPSLRGLIADLSGAGPGAGARGSVALAADRWRLPVRTHARGDRLYLSGAPAEAAFVVEAGLVALELDVPRARILALAGPGDVIGALAPSHGHYLEGATALSGEVAVRVLDDRAKDELTPTELTELLLAAAAARVVALTEALEDAEQPVSARVARAFLRLGSRFGQVLAGGAVRLTLPLTHDTLAAMVGAARETTTAVIAQLRQLGLVHGTRGSYLLRPAELAEYALEAALAG